MAWLLILMVLNERGGIHSSHMLFTDRERCEVAGKAAVDEFRPSSDRWNAEVRIRFVCVRT